MQSFSKVNSCDAAQSYPGSDAPTNAAGGDDGFRDLLSLIAQEQAGNHSPSVSGTQSLQPGARAEEEVASAQLGSVDINDPNELTRAFGFARTGPDGVNPGGRREEAVSLRLATMHRTKALAAGSTTVPKRKLDESPRDPSASSSVRQPVSLALGSTSHCVASSDAATLATALRTSPADAVSLVGSPAWAVAETGEPGDVGYADREHEAGPSADSTGLTTADGYRDLSSTALGAMTIALAAHRAASASPDSAYSFDGRDNVPSRPPGVDRESAPYAPVEPRQAQPTLHHDAEDGGLPMTSTGLAVAPARLPQGPVPAVPYSDLKDARESANASHTVIAVRDPVGVDLPHVEGAGRPSAATTTFDAAMISANVPKPLSPGPASNDPADSAIDSPAWESAARGADTRKRASSEFSEAQPLATKSFAVTTADAAIVSVPAAAVASGAASNAESGFATNPEKDASAAVPASREELATQASSFALPGGRVLERLQKAELRVGVNTAAFGNVEVQTSVADNRVSAIVSTAHGGLHSAMLAEMPALQQGMEQRQLRLEHFELNPQAGGHGHEAPSQDRPRSGAGERHSSSIRPNDPLPEQETRTSVLLAGPYAINVHA